MVTIQYVYMNRCVDTIVFATEQPMLFFRFAGGLAGQHQIVVGMAGFCDQPGFCLRFYRGNVYDRAFRVLDVAGRGRGGVGDAGYPADNTYSATAVDGSTGQVVVTATGVSGDATRRIEATIQL